uniref:Large ribosomal subunit protein bL20c n=1 Tax=Euglena clara TaxID=215708 RepID=A0A2Z4YXE8_9EUGL|nr:ribosomal protein L20 [Euglena clara]AXA45495.1 ribosomal protein L20 [Euglena clara]
MTRVKRGSVAKKRRKKILKLSSGFKGSHSKLFTTANQQVMKALRYSYFDRRKKKNNMKRLWIIRINAESQKYSKSYSETINLLKKKKIILNKKILSEIIINDPKLYQKIIL